MILSIGLATGRPLLVLLVLGRGDAERGGQDEDTQA